MLKCIGELRGWTLWPYGQGYSDFNDEGILGKSMSGGNLATADGRYSLSLQDKKAWIPTHPTEQNILLPPVNMEVWQLPFKDGQFPRPWSWEKDSDQETPHNPDSTLTRYTLSPKRPIRKETQNNINHVSAEKHSPKTKISTEKCHSKGKIVVQASLFRFTASCYFVYF